MRKEIALYERQFPARKNLKYLIQKFWGMIVLAYLSYRLKRINTGSVQWHRLQEKLSNGSSVGIDLEKRNLFYNLTLPRCGAKLCVFPQSVIYYPLNVEVGYNVFINRGVFITAPTLVTLGDNVLIGPYAVINSGMHNYKDRSIIIRDQGHTLNPIRIENDAWIGAHAVIMPGVTIGEGAIVGAGAVVTTSVEPYTIVAGVPAKQIGVRE